MGFECFRRLRQQQQPRTVAQQQQQLRAAASATETEALRTALKSVLRFFLLPALAKVGH